MTPSATHNFLYKTSKTAPKGAVFLIFSAIVITVFCCNNDVLLEKLSDIQKPLSQLHVLTILPDIKNSSRICSAFSHSFGDGTFKNYAQASSTAVSIKGLNGTYSFDGETLSLYSSDGKESTLSASLAGDRLIVTVPYSDKSMDIIYSRVK